MKKALDKERIKKFFKIFPFILSFISAIGIYGLLAISEFESLSCNSFVYIIIFGMYLIIYFTIKKPKLNDGIFLTVFSVFLSVILIIGSQLEFYSDIIWSSSTLIKIIALSIALFPINYFLLKFIKKFMCLENANIDYKKLFVKTFIIIFFFDFLVFLALYPGVYGYDSGYQIMQILESDVQITSHFSLLFSFLLAKIVNLGKILFNNYQIGFGMYCFLQMTFLSFVATKITIFCAKRIQNRFLYFINILFFSFFPLYTIMCISSVQDSVFAGIFCLVVLYTIELVENDNYCNSKFNIFKLSILILLLCLIRNNGFYAVLFVIPFIFLCCKKRMLVVLLIFIAPLIAYKFYSDIILNYLGVIKVDTYREMLSVPSQQFARVYNYNISAYTENEIGKLQKFYPGIADFKYYIYRQSIADPTKAVIDNDYVKDNFKEYIDLWFHIGIKDSKNYIEAFLLNSLGFWYPNKSYKDERIFHPYIEIEMLDVQKWNPKYLNIKRESKLPIYEKVLNKIVGDNAWKEIPIFSTVFTAGTYFIIFLYLLSLTILRKNFKYLLPISIIAGLYVTLLLSPVALFRYCFPIVMVSPLMLNLILYQKGKNS